MRIVLTAHPIYSHLVPFVLPVGQLLRRAGHDVVVATGAAGAEYVERAALPALVLPHVVTIGEVMRKALADESDGRRRWTGRRGPARCESRRSCSPAPSSACWASTSVRT